MQPSNKLWFTHFDMNQNHTMIVQGTTFGQIHLYVIDDMKMELLCKIQTGRDYLYGSLTISKVNTKQVSDSLLDIWLSRSTPSFCWLLMIERLSSVSRSAPEIERRGLKSNSRVFVVECKSNCIDV